MSPKYKLTYFDLTGLGEPIRYLFSYGNIEFEDKRVKRENWDKSSTEFGVLPILEIDGKIKVHQSNAIARYVGKLVGLAGKTDADALQADVIVDTVVDIRMNLSAYFRESDEAVKAEKLNEFINTTIPYYYDRFEKILGENGGTFVKGQLTWADVYFGCFSATLDNITKASLLDKYPKLKALQQKVENLPGIKEYIAKRPKTEL